jgi:hypothetical protein
MSPPIATIRPYVMRSGICVRLPIKQPWNPATGFGKRRPTPQFAQNKIACDEGNEGPVAVFGL